MFCILKSNFLILNCHDLKLMYLFSLYVLVCVSVTVIVQIVQIEFDGRGSNAPVAFVCSCAAPICLTCGL